MLLWVGGEVSEPERTIPRAMVGGFAATAVLFLLLNVACLAVLGYDGVASSPHVVSDLLERSIGSGVTAILTAVMVISVLGSLNASTLAASRVPYALARDGLLPRSLAWLHPDRRVPIPAVIAPTVGSVALLLTGTFEQLTSLFVFSQWLFYAVAIAALFRLRVAEPDVARPVKAWGYPVVPALFLAVALVLTASQIAANPLRSLVGFGVIVAGVPVFLARQRRA
jgi:APA family basic amino acid/polyamine antiporter